MIYQKPLISSKKTIAASITISLLAAISVTTAEATSTQKLTPAQAKVVYEKAIKTTSLWMDKNPFEVKTIDIYNGKTQRSFYYKKDSAKRLETYELYDGTAIYAGSKAYLTMQEDTLAPFEKDLATDLGLNQTAKFGRATTTALGIDAKEIHDIIIKEAKPEFWGSQFESVIRKVKYCTFKSSGKDQFLNCQMTYENFAGKKQVATNISTISGGRLLKEVYSENGRTMTTEYNSFKKSVKVPSGPYFEYDTMLNDPRYEQALYLYQTQLKLDSYIREVKFIAAFKDRELPNLNDWQDIAKEQGLKLYDRGIGFETYPPSKEMVEVCGVFTAEGAKLEILSCASLGFVEILEVATP